MSIQQVRSSAKCRLLQHSLLDTPHTQKGDYMRIAQVVPLHVAVPPLGYGGTERVVYELTEALVQMGHEVTLFASDDSRASARLIPMVDRAINFDPLIDPAGYHV